MPEVWELTTRDSLLGVDPGIHDCAWNCDTGHKRLMPGGIRRLLASARRHATSLAYCNSGIMLVMLPTAKSPPKVSFAFLVATFEIRQRRLASV